ncbi:RNA polymerase sigma factor [Membranihabitans maritimus]|uniref:RNA polymerase sigma factor n=1 Tax=Membranihabitans maritimus TaxID=2904244 RepID=UPI001F03165F|nr:RNA polymerase sigma-70 factor [Membranihabitans maritimus]
MESDSLNIQQLHYLYEAYEQRIYAFALSFVKVPHIAEDIVQDVFVKVCEMDIDYSNEKKLQSFLFTITRNHTLNKLRRTVKEKEILSEIKAQAIQSNNDVWENVKGMEVQGHLARAIDTLPPRRREIYQLCKVKGLSYHQTAEYLGVSYQTVNSQMVKAIKSIREYMSHYYVARMVVLVLFWWL